MSWFYHQLSDWIGDDGFIIRLVDSIRKFNYMGDTQFLNGSVVGKREENGHHLVDLEIKMVNQRGTETAYATATVALPSRAHGPVVLPDVPTDVQRDATRMFAHHNELAATRTR